MSTPLPITDIIQVAFNVDTTGSMAPCNWEVRRKIEEVLTRLFKEIPRLNVALGANGDYCDRNSSYVTTWRDFTTDIHELCKFVRGVRNTNGGDLPECYELVLREAQQLNWGVNAKKVFVLVADDIPHPKTDSQNIAHNGTGLDWIAEARTLAEMGVSVYAVQCLNKGRHADRFYRELTELTGGYHLRLDQFSEIVDLIMAVCFKQTNTGCLRNWESEVERGGRMTRTMDENFATLRERPIAERFSLANTFSGAVPPGRFQMLYVDSDCSIREFVEANGLLFKTGRGFYEFTKPELVQEKKEVVLRDKATGDMFSGDRARALIGLNPGERARVKPTHLTRFDVFVQSTSYNRKLIRGTRFLYEVDLDR